MRPPFLLLLFVLCFTGFSLFLALRVWTNDQIDRNRVHLELLRRRSLKEAQLSASRTVGLANDQYQMINMMHQQVDSFQVNNSMVDTLAHYNATRDAILAANTSCFMQITAMNIILMQLIEGNNSTPTNVVSATCILGNSGLTNDTMPIHVDYQLLRISGVEFYYYLVGLMDSALLVDSTHPAEISNCYPLLFRNDPVQRVLFAGGPFYSVIFGDAKVQLLSSVNQTFQFTEKFMIIN